MTSAASQLRISDAQFNSALDQLAKFVSIPSVSNPGPKEKPDPDYNPAHLERAAMYVASRVNELGFKVRPVRINEKDPVFILAERIDNAALPTILLYGHYDVQPVDRSKWDTDPFVLTRKGTRLFGRGASDDKAGVEVILAALDALLKEYGKLPVNVKILIEGEEEYGSNNIAKLLQQEAQNLNAQALIVMDGSNRDVNTGTIENFTRGVLTFELQVDALKKPVHSGAYLPAPDPAQGLVDIIHSLKPEKIPGFFDDCQPMSAEERANLRASSVSIEAFRDEIGVLPGVDLRGDSSGTSIYERLAEMPSISIVNMTCGQKGGGNSIQESAHATIGVRLTAGQDPDRMEAIILAHLLSQRIDSNMKLQFKRLGISAKAWKGDTTGPFAKLFLESLKENYKEAACMPTGGTIPFLNNLKEALPNMEMFIAGVEDPETSAHSHNESQDMNIFRNATNSLISFLQKAGNVVLKA